MVERLEEAEKIARELGDEARLVQILHWIANAYISNGFPTRGMPALFESYQLAERLGDERLTLVATFWMTSGMINRDPRGGLEQIERVIEAARKYHNWELEAHALAKKAMAHARLGEFAEAQDAVELAHEVYAQDRLAVKGADVASCRRWPFSIWVTCGVGWNIAGRARKGSVSPWLGMCYVWPLLHGAR